MCFCFLKQPYIFVSRTGSSVRSFLHIYKSIYILVMWSAYCINIASLFDVLVCVACLLNLEWTKKRERENDCSFFVSRVRKWLSSRAWRAPLGQSLEAFIRVIDKHPVAIVGLGALDMGEIVLDWRSLEVWRVGQAAHVDTDGGRSIAEVEFLFSFLTNRSIYIWMMIHFYELALFWCSIWVIHHSSDFI